MNLKKNAVVFTILLFCIFLGISCAAAGDANDIEITAYENQSSDVNADLVAASQDDVISSSNDDLVAASQDDVISASSTGTFAELQAMILVAPEGSTINLEKDYIYNNELNSTQGVIIFKDLTINGNGHTLNGLSKSRILLTLFDDEGTNKITLNNIVFKNGFTKLYGGAILNLADLTINNCVFEDNYAGTTAGAICSLGSLTCKNSKFNKNTADGNGGAIFSLNFVNSYSYFNSSVTYGLGDIIEKSGIISDYLNNIGKIIENSGIINDYLNNTVFNVSAATYLGNLGQIIEKNEVVTKYFNDLGHVIVESGLVSKFINTDGLAGYLNQVVWNNLLNNLGNVVASRGLISSYLTNIGHNIDEIGVIPNNLSDYIVRNLNGLGQVIAQSKVISNYINGIGGVLNVRNLVSNLISDVTLKPGTDMISNCKFTKNVALGRAGGAVYAFTHINIASSTFTSNKADQVGGAVYAAKNLNLKNSKFTSNKASVYGGAVYFKFHELSGSYDKNGKWKSSVKYYKGLIEKCVFTKNAVKNRGGAIYGFKYSKKPKLSAIKAVKCTFSDNQADVYNELCGGVLKSCTYKNTVTLKTVTVKKSAKKLVLTSTLKNGKKLLKNKKVTFKFNGKTYKAKTNKKGVAKVTVKSSVLKKLRVGSTIYYKVTYGKLHVKKLAKVKK